MLVHVSDALPGGDFETYRIPPNPDDGSLQGRLLIQVSASGRLEDHFRVVFGGGQHPSVTFSRQKISNHPIFGPYNLLPPRMLIRRMWTLRKIHLFPNGRTSTPWWRPTDCLSAQISYKTQLSSSEKPGSPPKNQPDRRRRP